jgi:hypothetical protein
VSLIQKYQFIAGIRKVFMMELLQQNLSRIIFPVKMNKDDVYIMDRELYYNREKLYMEIWAEPVRTVAKRYGVSDVALAKTCTKLKIPRPPVGYWAKKEAGKEPSRPELPVYDNSPNILIRTVIKQAESREDILVPSAFIQAQELIEKESFPEMLITIPPASEKEHPYVKNTRIYLEKEIKKTWYDQYGRMRGWGKDIFPVNIGPASVPRVTGILQALCDAFEKRGFAMTSRYNESTRISEISVKIMEQDISFTITENSVKSAIKPKDKYSRDYEYTHPVSCLSRLGTAGF